MQVLALICVLSLHGRVTLLENGGDWMLGELALWTAFLPLRAALLARRRCGPACARGARRPRPSWAIARRWTCRPSMNAVVSLAVLALVAADRELVHLQRDPQGRADLAARGRPCTTCCTRTGWCTWFAVWMRPYMTLWLSRILSWGSLVDGVDPAGDAAGAGPEGGGAPGGDRLRHRAAPRVPVLHQPGHLLVRDDRLHAVPADAARTGSAFARVRAAAQAPAHRLLRRGLRRLLPDRPACGRAWIGSGASRSGRAPIWPATADAAAAQTSACRPSCSRARWWSSTRRPGTRYTRADAVAQVLRAFPGGWLWSLPLRLPGPARARQLGLRPLLAPARDDLDVARARGLRVPAASRRPGSAAPAANRRSPSPRRRRRGAVRPPTSWRPGRHGVAAADVADRRAEPRRRRRSRRPLRPTRAVVEQLRGCLACARGRCWR